MSLDSLIDSYRKKEIKFNVEPSAKQVDRAEKVFDLSTQKNISTDDADAEVLIGELTDFGKSLDTSPLYNDADSLIDVFDPSEPPKEGEIPNPMIDIANAGIKAIKAPLKLALKLSGYIYSPVDRSLKFLTNMTMYDPLTKSAAGPIRKQIVQDMVNTETFKRLKEPKEQLRQELLSKHTDKTGIKHIAFREEFEKRFSELEEQTRNQVKKDLSGIINVEEKLIAQLPETKFGDFGKSAVQGLKALIPWPGAADDVKTTGQIASDSYNRIVGQEAPWFYAPVTDLAEQSVALAGLTKIAASAQTAKDVASIVNGAKLTKHEIKAIKKLHKAASQTKKIPAKAEAVVSSEDAATASQKLIKLLKEAKPLRKKKALLLHQDRQIKARKLSQVQKNVKGEKLVLATKKSLKGQAPVPDFDPINVSLTTGEIDDLFNIVNTSPLSEGFDKGRAILSLDKLLKGQLIAKSEIANLEVVFGRGLTKVLSSKRDISSIIQDLSFEIINLPRAIMSSYDLSAGGRQGIIFSVSHPISSMKAFGRSIRAAKSLKYTDDIERATRSSKWGQLADKFGIHSSPTGYAAKLSAKEELYMSNLAEKIPGVAQSERAFTTFLNQQRREVFKTQAQKWIRRGITPDENAKDYQQLAEFINHATGRGSLENMRPGTLTSLNAVFFSPRFQISRVQVIGDLINPKTTLNVRKVIARDLAEFYATGMGILAMAKAGGADVETDFRSSDFGKVKVGNTRYNYWGAFQPLVSLAGRMYAGEIKSTGTGKIKKKDRINLGIDNLIGNFLRTKLAPVPGRIVDALVGETTMGDPVEPTAEFAKKTAYESLVPLFIQDSIDAWKYQGMNGQFPLSAGLAFTGIGVQTWELEPFAKLELERDSLARETFGKNYDELSFIESQVLETDILINQPGIRELEQETKFNSNSVNFLKKQMLELRESERFINKRLDSDLLEGLTDAKIRIGGVDRTFGNWLLNDEQYKEYQIKVADNINKLFKEMKPVWDTKENSMEKTEIITRLLSSAKQLAAMEMKIGDME